MSNSADVQTLREQGFRMTPQRLQILHVLSSHAGYLNAEEIHAAIVPQQPALDIATVYRTLQWLQRVGMVASIDTGDGRLRYEYHRHGNHHHHLVCQSCGQSTEVPDEVVAALKEELQRRYDFVVDEHLVLAGRCAACAAAGKAEA